MMSTTTRKSGGGRKISLAYDEEVVDDPQRTTTDAVLPEAGDNCAIARVALAAGRAVRVAGRPITLRSRCPEGWRFAVRRVPAGAPLTSWSLPFGDAVRDVAAGDVLCNEGAALRGAAWTCRANFADRLDAYAGGGGPAAPAPQACARSVQPAATLAVALQCGGSDAFSGVSGNPCVGDAARRVVERGGRCLLAETDELMGAEAYVLARVRDGAVRDAFLALVDRYRATSPHGRRRRRTRRAGTSSGLYNIALKSLGAAKKKHASLRLEGCVEYGAPCPRRGYYFMDSPGNDLESVAGQVAAGCTVIHFVTGNGSVTNFPFAPTVKVVTTTARYALLAGDMDFDAGRYQAGAPMAALGRELFELTLRLDGGNAGAEARVRAFFAAALRRRPAAAQRRGDGRRRRCRRGGGGGGGGRRRAPRGGRAVVVAAAPGAAAAALAAASAALGPRRGGARAALARAPAPSLAFGQRPARAAAGVYVMDSPTSSLAEMTAASRAHADVVVCVAATPDGMLAAHGHAFVPVVRAAAAGGPAAAHADVVCDDPGAVDALLDGVARGDDPRALKAAAFVSFQVARGATGVSA
ncbi:D-galactarate dehydratase / altronate hydrolase [Aureococcus anophagefferens]|nr:D-galactarate dehydratase / altronate hydrolase [Aureococcus anophagefferens]